jgi:hypothetical protein
LRIADDVTECAVAQGELRATTLQRATPQYASRSSHHDKRKSFESHGAVMSSRSPPPRLPNNARELFGAYNAADVNA